MDAARRFRGSVTASRVASRYARLSGPEYAAMGRNTTYYLYRRYDKFHVTIQTAAEAVNPETERYTREMGEGLLTALIDAGLPFKRGVRLWTLGGYNVDFDMPLDPTVSAGDILRVASAYARAFRSGVEYTRPPR